MNKARTFSISFCFAMSGLALLLVSSADPVTTLIPLFLSPLLLFLYIRFSKPKKSLLALSSICSFCYSAVFASELTVKAGVLSKDCLYLVLILTCLCSLAIAFSNRFSQRYTALCTVLIASVILALVFLLSLVDTNFSPLSFGSVKKDFLLQFVVFSSVDSFLVLPLLKNEPRFAILGSVVPPLYMFALTLAAVSVLSSEVFFNIEFPLIRLWQSTYIASFVNSFEVIAVIAVFSLTLVKCGLVLAPAAVLFSKKRFWLLLILCILLSILCIHFNLLVTLFCVTVIACGLLSFVTINK